MNNFQELQTSLFLMATQCFFHYKKEKKGEVFCAQVALSKRGMTACSPLSPGEGLTFYILLAQSVFGVQPLVEGQLRKDRMRFKFFN